MQSPRFSGPQLRSHRIAAGLSPTQLGAAVNRSSQAIHGYETGQSTPPIEVAGRLAAALGVDMYALLEDELASSGGDAA